MGKADGLIVGACVTLTGVVDCTACSHNKTEITESVNLFCIFCKFHNGER